MQYTQLYKLISDVSRRRILAVLNDTECSVQDLQDVLGLGQSSISAHLAQLRSSELVDFRRMGRFILYRLAFGNNKEIDNFLQLVLEMLPKEDWFEKDTRKLQKLIAEKKETSLSFYEGLETQNKRSPGQTDHCLAIGLLRIIRNMTIVDVGCGVGRLSRELAKMDNKVIGIDSDANQIKLAQKTYAQELKSINLTFQVGDGESTGQKDNSVDLVVFSHSLHHIENPQLALKESSRILKPNGKIIVLDLAKHEERWMTKIFGDLHLGFDTKEIIKWLEEVGFKYISIDIDTSDDEYPQFESLIITAQK